MRELLLLFGLLATGFASDYPLTAHVLGSETHQVVFGRRPSVRPMDYTSSTDLQIGDRIYTIDRECKVTVGEDYPAQLEKKKLHVLLPNNKVCKGEIVAVRETHY